MQKISVVIICRNAAAVIGKTLTGFDGLTDDIVVYDNGSIDQTKEIVIQHAARLFEGDWEGFGKTKNKAGALAKYDWILSLDADETIDEQLKKNLLNLSLDDSDNVYEFRFKNFLGNQWIRYGAWKNDRHIRLFNRKKVSWNHAEVHESLILPAATVVKKISGYILHKTAASTKEFEIKMRNYAKLNAGKYFFMGKKSGLLKMYLAAAFSFVKNYFLRTGFADGKAGLSLARIMALYTFLKYKELNKLINIKQASR